MILYPNCKINIGLNIIERRPDGYHNLETTFYPTELNDVLEMKELTHGNAPYELHLTGNALEGNPDNNLVLKVYRSLQEEYNLPRMEFFLHKRIPSGAGLGGGSSDAAYTMRGLNELFHLELSENEMEKRLARFGADCPFFIRNRPVYATGIGTDFSPLNLSLKGFALLLIKPAIFVSTKEAYAGVKPTKPEGACANSWHNPLRNGAKRSKTISKPPCFSPIPNWPPSSKHSTTSVPSMQQ